METHELDVADSAMKGGSRVEIREANLSRDNSALMRLGKRPVLKVHSLSNSPASTISNNVISATLASCRFWASAARY
jgi:hypothetical protein